jgi:Flp pilus assembly protein TadG
MRLPRLLSSRFASEEGSAVTEFVLVVIPITILILPLLDLFGLFQAVLVKEQQAYEIARYASLADVTEFEAENFRISTESTSTLERLEFLSECTIQVTIPVSRAIIFWPYPIDFQARGTVHCEIA